MNTSTARISEVAGNCEKHGIPLTAILTPEERNAFNMPLMGFQTHFCATCIEEGEAQAAVLQAKRDEDYFIQRQQSAGVPPRFTEASLETFSAETAAQREVLAGLRQFQESWGTDPVNLILAGKLGAGKTFAGNALVNTWLRSKRSAIFTTALGLVRKIRGTWGTHQEEGVVVRRFITAGLLIIDEIGQQAGTPSERALIADVINGRYENLRPTVVIGNLTAAEFTEVLGERSLDRLKERGRTLVFDWESRRGKFPTPTPAPIAAPERRPIT